MVKAKHVETPRTKITAYIRLPCMYKQALVARAIKLTKGIQLAVAIQLIKGIQFAVAI